MRKHCTLSKVIKRLLPASSVQTLSIKQKQFSTGILTENMSIYCVLQTVRIGPLQLEVTWHKIQNIGEQKNVIRLHWEMETKKNHSFLV